LQARGLCIALKRWTYFGGGGRFLLGLGGRSFFSAACLVSALDAAAFAASFDFTSALGAAVFAVFAAGFFQ